MILPIGAYRFRADKGGVQYWSGPSNHCTVPGCTAATVTIAGQARVLAGNLLASRSPLVEPMALLMAPLLVGAVFRRRRKGRYWV